MLTIFKYLSFKKGFLSVLFLFVFCSTNGVSQYANIESDSLLALGNKVYRKGNYAESEKIYKEAVAKYSSDKKSIEWIIASVGLGASLLDHGDFYKARTWILRADSSITENTPLELQAYVKSNVGWVYKRFQEFPKAYENYTLALSLAKESKNQYRIAQVSNSLSLLTYNLGRYDESINFALTAVQSFEEIGDPFLLSLSYKNLSAAYEALGFINKAEEYLLLSFNMNLQLQNEDLISDSQFLLGSFYHRTGNYNKALIYYSKYLSYVKAIGDVPFISPAYDYIGAVYMSLGEFEKALEYFNNSEQLRREFNLYGNASTISNIALTYQQLGQFDHAHNLFDKAQQAFKENKDQHNVIDTYLKLSDLNLKESSFKQAKELAETALSLALETESKQLIAKSFAAVGKAYATLGDTELALEFSRKAFNIASIFKGYRLANYSIDLAKAYYKAENDSAFYYADFAFSEIEREQSTIYGDNLESSLFSDYAEFYDEVALWYLEKEQNIKKAFEITERGRSRVLLERLSFSESNFENLLDEPTLINIRQKEKNIDKIYRKIEATTDPKELDYLREELRNAEFEYQSFTNAIRLNNPKLNAFEQLPLASISDLQNKMTSDDAIIEYMITESNLVTFWITKSDLSYHIIEIDSLSGPLEYFSNKISDFRTAIQNQESIEILETLSRPLLDPLINPFLERFPHINQVILVPTHSLSILPFDALYSNGSFLIERLNIKYLPSSSIYNSIQNPHRETSKEILAVAGSGFDSGTSSSVLRTQSSFASLPSSLLEIEAISNVFTNYTTLKNEQVTESIIKSLPLGEYRYLHFATHAIVNEKNPQQSGLIISKMNDFENSFGEDGYLNSLEVSNLTLNADLVVLSACNTAIGKLVEGEGLLGLQRSFFKAGASAVIVSLWNVYDKSTSILMGDFYRNLNKYELSELGWWSKMKIYLDVYEPPYFGYKEKALRDAKLTMIDHPYYNHPVNWAPFILIGK